MNIDDVYVGDVYVYTDAISAYLLHLSNMENKHVDDRWHVTHLIKQVHVRRCDRTINHEMCVHVSTHLQWNNVEFDCLDSSVQIVQKEHVKVILIFTCQARVAFGTWAFDHPPSGWLTSEGRVSTTS